MLCFIVVVGWVLLVPLRVGIKVSIERLVQWNNDILCHAYVYITTATVLFSNLKDEASLIARGLKKAMTLEIDLILVFYFECNHSNCIVGLCSRACYSHCLGYLITY